MTNVSDAKGTKFKRALNPRFLTDEALASYPLLEQLLALYSPAGHDSDGGRRLRVFIRNEYANFYAVGQSVFLVSFGMDGLKFQIHKRYVSEDVPSTDQGHVSIPGSSRQSDLAVWHERARCHPSKKVEKAFVDLLLGANPDVIDVEAALPGVSVEDAATGEDRLVAPRMDLVALEPCAGGYRLVFWEAKLSDNPETRVKVAEEMPKVVGQLRKYKERLEDPENRHVVIAAYAEVCRMLFALNGLANGVLPLGPAIIAIGSGRAEIVDLDPQIRLVIRESRKEGPKGKTVRAFRDPAFTQNGHAQKLKAAGVPLKLVGPGGSFVLASEA